MAYSAAALSAEEIAYAAADKPLIGAITSRAFSAGRWVASATGTFATADDTNATYPFRNCVDGLANVQTRPTTSGTGMAMLFDFGSAGIDFDAVAFFNHTLDSDACTDCDIEIANDSAFSTNLIELASFNPSTLLSSDRRFTRLDLQDSTSAFGVATRYTSVRYARIQLTFGSGKIPRIGEVAFIRRRQFKWKPNNEAYDPDRLGGAATRTTSASGINRDMVYHYGKRVMEFAWTPNASTQHDDLIAWHAQTGWGQWGFVYIDEPATAPNDVYLMSFEPALDFMMPFVNWQARDFKLSAVEQGPYFMAVAQT